MRDAAVDFRTDSWRYANPFSPTAGKGYPWRAAVFVPTVLAWATLSLFLHGADPARLLIKAPAELTCNSRQFTRFSAEEQTGRHLTNSLRRTDLCIKTHLLRSSQSRQRGSDGDFSLTERETADKASARSLRHQTLPSALRSRMKRNYGDTAQKLGLRPRCRGVAHVIPNFCAKYRRSAPVLFAYRRWRF